MKIAIIDADLIGRKNHRFPNLVCEKISSFHKSKNDDVELKLSYDNLSDYDHVYISKVFTDTPIDSELIDLSANNISYGGTGFFFDKAQPLPDEIEHFMPDYHLYDQWIESQPLNQRTQYKEYMDCSIGFLTRGCFRKCPFCVNQKYNKVFAHSPLEEFFDPSRKRIVLLDDNFLGYSGWKPLLTQLMDTKKPFCFKQGLDERLLTDEKCEMLFNSNYSGDFTFAFDNIEDYDLIQNKLQMIRSHSFKRNIKFYVLVGFKSVDIDDVVNAFKKIELLMKYNCIPYIMRYQNINDKPYKNSKFSSIYTYIACWCNQPSLFKKKSFRQFCELKQSSIKTKDCVCSALKALNEFEKEYPEIASRYFDLKCE